MTIETTDGDAVRFRDDGRGRQAESPTDIPLEGWKDVLWRVYAAISDDRVMLVSAGVTYYLILAFVPELSALLSIYWLAADRATVAGHVGLMAGIVPAGALQIVEEQLKRLASQDGAKLGFAFAVSLGVALWSTNAGVKSLFDAMNIAYRQKETRSFVRLTLVSLLFTVCSVATAIAMLGALVVLPLALSYLGYGEGAEWLARGAGLAVLLVVVSFGVAALYRWGPDRRDAKWRWITPGTILCVLSTILVSAAFSWYAANFGSYDATYGSLGAVIGFMTWIWLTCMLLIVGGELNSELEHQTALDSTVGREKPLGSRGAVMADTVAGLDRARAEAAARPSRPERISWGTLAVAAPASAILTGMSRRRT